MRYGPLSSRGARRLAHEFSQLEKETGIRERPVTGDLFGAANGNFWQPITDCDNGIMADAQEYFLSRDRAPLAPSFRRRTSTRRSALARTPAFYSTLIQTSVDELNRPSRGFFAGIDRMCRVLPSILN